MGQQQLHLLVLGIILVGIAFIVGLDGFQNKAVESNRDAVINDLNYLASYAKAYFKKSTVYGGGGNSFVGYNVPEKLKENENGTYSLISAQPTKVILRGVGKEKAGSPGCSQGNNITYHLTVEPNLITLQKIK
jgi:hypothetical protein